MHPAFLPTSILIFYFHLMSVWINYDTSFHYCGLHLIVKLLNFHHKERLRNILWPRSSSPTAQQRERKMNQNWWMWYTDIFSSLCRESLSARAKPLPLTELLLVQLIHSWVCLCMNDHDAACDSVAVSNDSKETARQLAGPSPTVSTHT